ncbi:two-component system regulatory protein YycI [Aquibacillus kalidii]|uniref:two-component system regulatory protein YycI n=1 Tax=Aquibacillus kalidii TaxID=2762597 RepID=UPI00164945FF|nr:two-component system regulatory protein YycI [Aquibacillus kalidii]
MQWGQIKSLFILCFFILDIFLVYQFVNNRIINESYLPESAEEDNLKNNVLGLDKVPEGVIKESELHTVRKEFTKDDIAELDKFENQKSVVINSNTIISVFDSPVEINPDSNLTILDNNVISWESYQKWGIDQNTNSILLFQKMEYPIFFNQSGLLLVKLNEDGKMIGYIQTMLEKKDDPTDTEPLIKAYEAVSTLYHNGKIQPDDEIRTNMVLGYHNILPLPDGAQVLIPTWEVQLKDGDVFYVNAVERHYQSRDETVFVEETLSNLRLNLEDAASVELELVNFEEGSVKGLTKSDLITGMLKKFDATIGVEKNDVEL